VVYCKVLASHFPRGTDETIKKLRMSLLVPSKYKAGVATTILNYYNLNTKITGPYLWTESVVGCWKF
jgi:hypothetical protein